MDFLLPEPGTAVVSLTGDLTGVVTAVDPHSSLLYVERSNPDPDGEYRQGWTSCLDWVNA